MQLRRRRRCVRPSAPEKASKHFMKAILPSPIHSTQIRIPDEFITRFGNELKDVVTITVPDGRVWEMKLMKRGIEVYFCSKWQEFVEYYCIGYGCYLCFKYEGNSKFSVTIFGITSVEISYPFQTYTKVSSPKKRFKVEKSEKKVTSMSKHASKRAEDAANEFSPDKPYFRSRFTKIQYANVTSKFARKYLKPNVPIKLQNSDGHQWEVSCIFYNAQALSMRMVRGFIKFGRDNNLSDGDICVFELINEMPVVLKVTMFRAIDYVD